MSDVCDLQSETDVARYLFRAGAKPSGETDYQWASPNNVTPTMFADHMALLRAISRSRCEGVVIPEALRHLDGGAIRGTLQRIWDGL